MMRELHTAMRFLKRLLLFSMLGYTFVSCGTDANTNTDAETVDHQTPAQTTFELQDTAVTGVTFVNLVEDRNDFNILTYRNYYNGGGVAIGDINNDGLPDLYFTSNLKKNCLYLNQGDWRFEDVTERAGVGGARAWSTGATMADINGDGWLDIYVSNSGDVSGDNKENELFINNGDLTFTESAAAYGLNNQGYSTQAAFFDYDLDGDLDCYLLNNSFKDPSRIELFRSMRDDPDELGGDKLYRNDGGSFTDVTEEAGIYSSEIGFGLGAAIGDVNHDLYPDIYVSNDFWERDYLYLNQGDGTFSEELINRIDFCSISSMGGDLADINNDGHPEIISTDMLAADNYRLKAMSAFDPYHLEDRKYRANYHYQIGQNCLHLNDGTGNFQEIAMLSEVAATDWSWGALIFDFDNDGYKDLFVSNGIQKDLMYMDFRDFLANNGVYAQIARGGDLDYPGLVSRMPSNPIKNYAFVNQRDLTFTNAVDELGLGQASFSNGAAYADLDNDGDLDLVINNVNEPAFLYRNQAEKLDHHYLKIKFAGPSGNPLGIGAWVKLTTDDGIQTWQNFNTRGFQSSVEPSLIFGLGSQEEILQLEVIWPDRKRQVIQGVQPDQTLTLNYTDASDRATSSAPQQPESTVLFEEVPGLLPPTAAHVENRYNDFDHEILLFRMLSTESPRLLQGDVNGDALADVILLGAYEDADKLFLQQSDHSWQQQFVPAFGNSTDFESTCGSLLDLDNDGDLDLLIGSGGNEYQRGKEAFTVRAYQNNGQGAFTLWQERVPPVVGNFSCLQADDFDGDGLVDIFLGGRIVPGNYGLPPLSYLLRNTGAGWEDVTPEKLAGVGMVTDAAWADIDGDTDRDLIVVGDWMSIHVFKNNNGAIQYLTPVRDTEGWWTRIASSDLDQDGDVDFVVGNWGLNTKFKASTSKPLTMFVKDFDQNGKSEFIINWYAPADDQAYPFATKMDLTTQLPGLRKQALEYEVYAHQTYESLFSPQVRQNDLDYRAENLHTGVLWNDEGHLRFEALPVMAQIAPVFSILAEDLTGDAVPDIWLGGNFYALKPQAGRQAASRGVLLEGKGGHRFDALNPGSTGLSLEGEVRDATVIRDGDQVTILVARNNAPMAAFQRAATVQ